MLLGRVRVGVLQSDLVGLNAMCACRRPCGKEYSPVSPTQWATRTPSSTRFAPCWAHAKARPACARECVATHTLCPSCVQFYMAMFYEFIEQWVSTGATIGEMHSIMAAVEAKCRKDPAGAIARFVDGVSKPRVGGAARAEADFSQLS